MPRPLDPPDVPRPARRLPLVLAWLTVCALFALILREAEGIALPTAAISALVWYGSIGVLVWFACAADRRFELWNRPPMQILCLHLAMGAAAMGLWTATITGFMRWRVGPGYWQLVFPEWWWQFATTAVVYAAGVGVGLTGQGFDRQRERQQRAARLEALAREAELTALKAQLQPHFLFNALNSILALVDDEPAEARRMLTRLASLLHSVFDRLDEPLVPLDRELETIRDYLDIERIRFGDRMTFSIDAEAAAQRVAVPPFLLQPLVENAVKHGIEPYARPGAVRVEGCVDGERLRLSVADTGNGDGSRRSPGLGHGLALTRRRLQTIYGANAAILRTDRSAAGFTVTLDLPVAPSSIDVG